MKCKARTLQGLVLEVQFAYFACMPVLVISRNFVFYMDMVDKLEIVCYFPPLSPLNKTFRWHQAILLSLNLHIAFFQTTILWHASIIMWNNFCLQKICDSYFDSFLE